MLPRWRQLQLFKALAQEAGWGHLGQLAALSAVSSVLDIAGLGLAITLLLSKGSAQNAMPGLSVNLPLTTSLALLVGLILLRGLIQGRVAVSREQLRSGFTDRLRQQLLQQVFSASSTQLEQLGRGDLLALLMADINRTALGLDQAVRMLQALLAMLIYLASVLLVGRTAAWPLLLALMATAIAALLQRSGSWSLGRIQSRLNAALQRTVGDGLHGLKAVRAAATERWLLDRFAQETAKGRWLLRERVRRRAGYNAWRDTLVVAYRAGSSLSGVVQARRLCLGNLPGYEALCLRREQLRPGPEQATGTVLNALALATLERNRWTQLDWCSASRQNGRIHSLRLLPNQLVAVTGPSGWGKTTLLDQISGLRDEEHSAWTITCGRDRWQLSGPAGARQLHQLMACAPQHAALFEASLRDNLVLGREIPDATIATWLSAWDWRICSIDQTVWMLRWLWPRTPFPAVRFTDSACCAPGSGTGRWTCWMNPQHSWMPLRQPRCAR